KSVQAFTPAKRLRKFQLFSRLWFTAVLIELLFLSVGAASAHAEKLYVVYGSISGTQVVGWIAKEANLFAKHGLDGRPTFHRRRPRGDFANSAGSELKREKTW